MWLAVTNADPAVRLTIMTDSMNVINALQAWSRREFLRDMTRQLNAAGPGLSSLSSINSLSLTHTRGLGQA
eukprot:3207961-Rhodomonas_salina.1